MEIQSKATSGDLHSGCVQAIYSLSTYFVALILSKISDFDVEKKNLKMIDNRMNLMGFSNDFSLLTQSHTIFSISNA